LGFGWRFARYAVVPAGPSIAWFIWSRRVVAWNIFSKRRLPTPVSKSEITNFKQISEFKIEIQDLEFDFGSSEFV
jgi:hypothetical protein